MTKHGAAFTVGVLEATQLEAQVLALEPYRDSIR
jgi:hypothetical protein